MVKDFCPERIKFNNIKTPSHFIKLTICYIFRDKKLHETAINCGKAIDLKLWIAPIVLRLLLLIN